MAEDRNIWRPFQMLPEAWEASKPATNSGSGGLARSPQQTGSFGAQASGGYGEPPTAACARPGASARGQDPGMNARHPDQRSPPSMGPMDLPGPSACAGRGPRSYRCEGGPVRRTGDERHRSVRAYGERQRWSGVGFAPASGSRPEFPWQSRARHKGGAARGSGGFRGVQETALGAVSCWRFKAFARE